MFLILSLLHFLFTTILPSIMVIWISFHVHSLSPIWTKCSRFEGIRYWAYILTKVLSEWKVPDNRVANKKDDASKWRLRFEKLRKEELTKKIGGCSNTSLTDLDRLYILKAVNNNSIVWESYQDGPDPTDRSYLFRFLSYGTC